MKTIKELKKEDKLIKDIYHNIIELLEQSHMVH